MADWTLEKQKRLDRLYVSAALALIMTIILVCHPVSAACDDWMDHTTCAEHAGCSWHDNEGPEDEVETGCYGTEVTPTPTPTSTPTPTPTSCSGCGCISPSTEEDCTSQGCGATFEGGTWICTSPSTCDDQCYTSCGYTYSSCASGTADWYLAWALHLAGGCGVSGWQWSLISNQFVCHSGNVNTTPAPPNPVVTPYPTSPPYEPNPPSPIIIHPQPTITLYPTITEIPTVPTVPTLPIDLVNDTDVCNSAKNNSAASWCVNYTMTLEDTGVSIFATPIYTYVFKPVSEALVYFTGGYSQGIGLLNLFAAFPKLFFYAGLVTIARMPYNVQLLCGAILWINLMFRGYDFARGVK